MHLIFHDNLFDPNRLVFKKRPPVTTTDAIRNPRVYMSYHVEKPETKTKKKKDAGEKQGDKLGEKAKGLEKDKEKKEDEASKESKKKRKGLRKHVESGPHLNKVRDLLKKNPGLFRKYVRKHKPNTYGTGDWKKKWNPDFGKDVIGVDKEHGKYARALQKILKLEEGIKMGGIDGRMGKKTVRALAQYLGMGLEKGHEHLELTKENEHKYFNAYKRALKAGYPNLDLGRGYIIDRPTFTAIFNDIVVGAQVSFDPLNIRGWEGRFRGLLPLIGRDELSLIYPYYPIRKPTEPPKKAPLIAKIPPIILEREKQPKDELSEANLEGLPNIAYGVKIGPKSDRMKKGIDGNYEWIYGRNLKNLKAGKEVDAGVALTEDYLESGPKAIQKTYNSYLDKVTKLKEQKRETKKVLGRTSSAPAQKEEAEKALKTAESEKDKAMANLEIAVDKDKEKKKKELDTWLSSHDLPENIYLTDEYIAVNTKYIAKRIPIAKKRIYETMKNSERSKIFKTFKDFVKNCNINKLGALEDSLTAKYKKPEELLSMFNDAIFAKNIKEYIQFRKTLKRRT